MNERIRELMIKADYPAPELALRAHRLTELIVAECLEACSRANEIRHFVPPTQEQVVLSCMREIEQHFGVSND
jgi:hypothetical protein